MADLIGVVKKVPNKQFGFILTDEGIEYFFHAADCMDNNFAAISDGNKVTFVEVKSDKGPRAGKVKKK